MRTINVKKAQATAIRRCVVPFVDTNEDGTSEAVELEIYYRGLTLDESSQFTDLETLAGEARNDEVKRQLAFIVERIPNFVDDAEQPVATDVAFFAALDVALVNAISEAIAGARTTLPTKPSLS